ncbi:MAG: heavy-metal-associated domain-containing protein [Gammaproteobacteria bacterium]|jgi:copper chaperone|nr:heavy-metal-associated domain-containing protein [Gammaproteobacteria bacterium]MBU0769816.1 heavy-metal-associated domain-containing protein [Gammaproteobacteria bacterium]MBU0856595.1 heavy-metal-associated domain-containing protein [Gammaproteobacteria bacterium]MBU1847511.1 heavy-metal-associated domain-containing protein [Gammaproteobacteria bacterium]
MIEFTVPDMTCGHCAGRIRTAVSEVDGKATVDIDIARHVVRIQSSQDEALFRQALADADYPPA